MTTARAERHMHGHIKLIADRRGTLLGAAIVGHGARDLILPWIVAIAERRTVSDMVRLSGPSGGIGDIGRLAASQAIRSRLTNPVLRRIISVMRRFG